MPALVGVNGIERVRMHSHLGALGGPQRIGARAPTFAWVRGIRVGAVQAFRSHDAAEKNPELGLG